MPVSGLSSSSTMAQVKAAYDDNASYDVDNSVTECQTFIAACRILLRRLPSSAEQGDSLRIDLDVKLIRDELRRAVRWYNAQSGESLRFSDFGDFRR